MSVAVKQKIMETWNQRAEDYDEQFGHGLKSLEEKEAWKEVLKAAVGSENLDILDVGTGTGFLALILSELGHNCTGIDISEKMLNQAKKKAVQNRLPASFHYGDAEQLSFKEGSFDIVINRHLLWTLPHPELAMENWIKVLKPGGKLVIIEGKWMSDSIFLKLKTFVGKCLIALVERKNPWEKYYDKEIRESLPFMGGLEANKTVQLMNSMGLYEVEIMSLDRVIRAQKKVMPPYRKLLYNYERYVVTGKKM
ncbi:MAG: class I SAM-dependent methyltransferase [Dethiobacter sp.]|jgi:ubiquinone/menaquinone biosynthesis C-methylase UbiE|nr:MAG: class I SAM-dependent methyltransferase [Dethiobacter sp.]